MTILVTLSLVTLSIEPHSMSTLLQEIVGIDKHNRSPANFLTKCEVENDQGLSCYLF